MVIIHLTLHLLVLLTLVESQSVKKPKPNFIIPESPKIPKTQIKLPIIPVSIGVGIKDKQPTGIVKFKNKNQDLTVWTASNLKDNVEVGTAVKSPKRDFITKGSINTRGKVDVSIGVKTKKVEVSFFGTNKAKNPSSNTGNSIGVGVRAKIKIGGGSRSNKGGRRRGFLWGRRGGRGRGRGGAGGSGGGGGGGGGGRGEGDEEGRGGEGGGGGGTKRLIPLRK